MSPEPELPPHFRFALAQAQKAFETGNIRSLASVNENLQGLVDAALRYAQRVERTDLETRHRTWTERPAFATTEVWASLRLYEAAEALRMSASGSADPMPEDEQQIVRATLARRLAAWRPSASPIWADADEALRQFLVAALRETAGGAEASEGPGYAKDPPKEADVVVQVRLDPSVLRQLVVDKPRTAPPLASTGATLGPCGGRAGRARF